MDHESAAEWLGRYVNAWKSYDPEEIGDLFADDIEYRYSQSDSPITGKTEVVRAWIDEPDPSGTYEAEYSPFAVEGDRVVAIGWTRYFTDKTRTEVRATYDNCFILEFDSSGRCRRYTDWYKERG